MDRHREDNTYSAMESLPWIPESEHLFSNKNLVDGSESSNAKRKVESLFCVMRKRICRRHKFVNDDMFLDLDNAEIGDDGDDIPKFLRPESDFRFENLMDNPYDPLDEGSIVDDCGSDTDLSESSEFDVMYEHVLEDNDLITRSKFLSFCNFSWPNEDMATLTSKWSSETLKSSLLLSHNEDEVQDSSLFHSERGKGQMSSIPQLCEDILRCSVNKEDSEIPCNSDIFKNDADKSSATEVRYGDVVNMEGCMECMCRNDEVRLWNKDDEPMPITIVPPDGWSSILQETGLLHQIVGCINEDNVRDDSMGIEISPLPLPKTLERPSRPWSVCGSIAAVRNLPQVEDSSGACSSLDEQLYVNVSNSEDRNAGLAQNHQLFIRKS